MYVYPECPTYAQWVTYIHVYRGCNLALLNTSTLFSRNVYLQTCATCGLTFSCCVMSTTWGKRMPSLYFTGASIQFNHYQKRLKTMDNGTSYHNGTITAPVSICVVFIFTPEYLVTAVSREEHTSSTLPSMYVWTMMTKPIKLYLPTCAPMATLCVADIP